MKNDVGAKRSRTKHRAIRIIGFLSPLNILTLLFFWLPAPFTLAADNMFGIAIQGGLTATNVATNTGGITNARTSVAGGIHFEAPIGDLFYLQPEVMYLPKGYKVVGGTGDTTIRLDYIEVPILARAKFGFPPLSFDILSGPAVGFVIAKKKEVAGGTSEDKTDITGTDFTIHVGGGLSLDLAESYSLFFSARYMIGLTNVMSSSSSASASLKNKGFLVLAGFVYWI